MVRVPAHQKRAAAHTARGTRQQRSSRNSSRGLHPFTSQLHLSAFYAKGHACRGYVARIQGVSRACRVLLCVKHGSS
jgi:hypothetical protein